ncbi:unnamed protein product [Urochloa decumbens]|uniref:Uncharacterized protein n=1 Tax=Urochloa decumbens TaxID=240449 RepID=A0ABC8ZEM0_9POAL
MEEELASPCHPTYPYPMASSPCTEQRLPGVSGGGGLLCFHDGEKWKRPPIDEAELSDANEMRRRFIDGFYEEAARRLPLGEVPGLDGCVVAGGLCVGLADPVSNIILNAVGLLLHDQQEQEREFRVRRDTHGWVDIGRRSLSGLRGFMTAYFRYLDRTQGSRYLYLASHHLPLAIALVRRDRRQRRLLPGDGGNLRDALRIAAAQANHPAPDVLARLMTAQYPSGPLAAVVAKLRATAEPLTAGDVSGIMDLLARQWRPASMEFWCRPSGGTWCTQGDDGTLTISTCTADGRAATVLVRSSETAQQGGDDDQLACISDLTFHGADMEDKLLRIRSAAAAGTTAAAPVDYDASPCTHILSLHMCLLDAMYAFYIRALAVLPSCSRRPRLLRAVLVGGHCYGPMDPVSNIIVNAAWFDMAFPLLAELELPQAGILDSRPMVRLAYRSLQALVEMASATLGCGSRHEALDCINSLDCDLFSTRRSHGTQEAYAAAAKAAKHPHHAAFGSFLASLTTEKLARLRCVLPVTGDGRIIISDDQWEQLKAILAEESPDHQSVPNVSAEASMVETEAARPYLSPSGSCHVSTRKTDFQVRLDFVHTHINKLLRRYCYQHPWEPSYQVDIVCGVWHSNSSNYRPNVFHVNFLASSRVPAANSATTSTRERTLFFAEFWVASLYPGPGDVQPKASICCPVSGYTSSIGRCLHCENEGTKIIHPSSGGHSGVVDGVNNLYPVNGVGFKGLLDSDFIYFDPDRDVELAKAINDFQEHHGRYDVPRMTWTTQRPKSSLVWGWSGDNLFGPLPKIPDHDIKLSFT